MRTAKIAAFAAAVMLAGCYSSGVKVDQGKLASLHPGETTYEQTVALLGSPTTTVVASDGRRTAIYAYTHMQTDAINFVPIVGAFAGGANTETTTLMVNFDPSDKLINYTSSQGSNQVGTGILSGQSQ